MLFYFQVQKIADQLTEIKKSIVKCNNDPTCLAALSAKISADLVTIPSEIAKDVTEVVTIIRNIEPEIRKCGTDVVTQCNIRGPKLLKKITQCVINKIKH